MGSKGPSVGTPPWRGNATPRTIAASIEKLTYEVAISNQEEMATSNNDDQGEDAAVTESEKTMTRGSSK